MKVDAVIIKDKKSGLYTGFVKKYPGVCSQADNVDTLLDNLNKYLKHWFKYVAKNSKITQSEDIYSFS